METQSTASKATSQTRTPIKFSITVYRDFRTPTVRDIGATLDHHREGTLSQIESELRHADWRNRTTYRAVVSTIRHMHTITWAGCEGFDVSEKPVEDAIAELRVEAARLDAAERLSGEAYADHCVREFGVSERLYLSVNGEEVEIAVIHGIAYEFRHGMRRTTVLRDATTRVRELAMAGARINY